MVKKCVNRAKNGKIGESATKRKKASQMILKGFFLLVGVAGFEPTTPAPKAGALTGLRYTPSFPTLTP